MREQDIDYGELNLDREEAIELVAQHREMDRYYDGWHIRKKPPLLQGDEVVITMTARREGSAWMVRLHDTREYLKKGRKAAVLTRYSVKFPGLVKERGVKRKKPGRKKMPNQHRAVLIQPHWWWNALNELSLRMGFWKDISNRGWMRCARWLLQESILEKLSQSATDQQLVCLPAEKGWEIYSVPLEGRQPILEQAQPIAKGFTRRHAWRNALRHLDPLKPAAPWPVQQVDWPQKEM